jgi:subtilisin family serine protease
MKLRRFANGLFALFIAAAACLPSAFVVPKSNSVDSKVYMMDTFGNDNYTFFDNKTAGGDVADLLGLRQYNTYLREKKTSLPEVVVAVMDSGINASHPVFDSNPDDDIPADRLLTEQARDFSDSGSLNDTTGHGTHVAGIIADSTLPNVKILPIKIFGDGKNTSAEVIRTAIDYIVGLKNKFNIVAVNMSLGTAPMSSSNSDYYVTYNYYQSLVNELLKVNILPVVAAGNGIETKDGNVGTSLPSFPAACRGVVAVSAFDARNYDGDTAAMDILKSSNYGSHIALSAPGQSVISADKYASDETSMSGTSMATPFVAAAYAALSSDPLKDTAAELGVSWDADKDTKSPYYYLNPTHKALLFGALDFGIADNDIYFGYGCVNLSGFTDDNMSVLDIKDPVPSMVPNPNVTQQNEASPLPAELPNIVLIALACAGVIILIYAIKGKGSSNGTK